MSSELVATYSGLGTKDGEEYYKGQECLACVKDLIRALRGDDDHCGVRRHLGKAHVLQTDLIPLLVHFNDDITLRNDIIRLLVNLTQPVCLCFPDTLSTKDIAASKCVIEVSQYLRQYKEEFSVESVMNILGSILADLCQKDWEDRDDDDVIIIERILLLIRNVLHIPPEPSEEKRTDDDVSTHDQIIWNLHINGIDELLLFLGSNPNETQWCMHVLEILFLLLREQSPGNLATAGQTRSFSEREKDENKIDELIATEKAYHGRSKHLRGSRHSNFGGAYLVANQFTVSGNSQVYHRPLAGVNEYSYDIEKRPRRTPRPKRPMATPPQPRLSTYSIRLVLKEFCVQVLDYCFNVLMRVVKDTIKRQRSMENDETYYLWTMRFFMEFSRLHNFRVDIISECLQLPTVHQVLQLTANYYEHLVMNKRDRPKSIEWGQRLHYSIQAYKELLLHVQEMTQSNDKTIVKSSKVILSNLLYHPEYRDVFVMLLRNYNEAMLPLTFLHDVIEMTHIYLRLVNLYAKQNGQLVIQKKRKSHISKKKLSQQITEDQLLQIWENVKDEIERLLNEGELDMSEAPSPFDAASEIPIEEQKLTAMRSVYQDICQHNLTRAVLLVRGAREIWPNDIFGTDTVTSNEELSIIEQLLFNPLSATVIRNQDDDNDDEEEVPQEESVNTIELKLDLNKFTMMFANNKIVRVYSLVLANYKSNSDVLNHAVVKILYTIAVKHEMAPMLYQISIFRIFSNILNEPPLPRYKELQKLSRHIVAGFFLLAQHNTMAFVEVLVWKTTGDCYELKEGYGALQRRKDQQKNRNLWTREQEDELVELFERFKDENDIVGCILAALPPDLCRSRKAIASQLVTQGLVGNRKDLHKKKTKEKGPWSEEELFTLQSLWQPNDDVDEAIQQLTCYFPNRGIRNIKQQLQQLGLIKTKTRNKETKTPLPIDDSSDDDIKDESEVVPSQPILTTRVNRKGTKHCNIQNLIQRIHSDGHTEQLGWLTTYIADEAKDRALDNEWEELCIVAVEQSVAEALETELFRDLMTSLGLTPPTDQEMYWRIPSTLGPQDLDGIVNSLSSTCTDTNSTTEQEIPSSDEEDYPQLRIVTSPINSDPEDSLTASEALALLRKKRKQSSATSETVEQEPVNKKSRLRTQFQSDDENEDDNLSIREDVKTQHDISHSKMARRKKNILLDDSDEEASETSCDDHVTSQMTNFNSSQVEILHHIEKNTSFNSDEEMSCDDHVINQELNIADSNIKNNELVHNISNDNTYNISHDQL